MQNEIITWIEVTEAMPPANEGVMITDRTGCVSIACYDPKRMGRPSCMTPMLASSGWYEINDEGIETDFYFAEDAPVAWAYWPKGFKRFFEVIDELDKILDETNKQE